MWCRFASTSTAVGVCLVLGLVSLAGCLHSESGEQETPVAWEAGMRWEWEAVVDGERRNASLELIKPRPGTDGDFYAWTSHNGENRSLVAVNQSTLVLRHLRPIGYPAEYCASLDPWKTHMETSTSGAHFSQTSPTMPWPLKNGVTVMRLEEGNSLSLVTRYEVGPLETVAVAGDQLLAHRIELRSWYEAHDPEAGNFLSASRNDEISAMQGEPEAVLHYAPKLGHVVLWEHLREVDLILPGSWNEYGPRTPEQREDPRMRIALASFRQSDAPPPTDAEMAVKALPEIVCTQPSQPPIASGSSQFDPWNAVIRDKEGSVTWHTRDGSNATWEVFAATDPRTVNSETDWTYTFESIGTGEGSSWTYDFPTPGGYLVRATSADGHAYEGTVVFDLTMTGTFQCEGGIGPGNGPLAELGPSCSTIPFPVGPGVGVLDFQVQDVDAPICSDLIFRDPDADRSWARSSRNNASSIHALVTVDEPGNWTVEWQPGGPPSGDAGSYEARLFFFRPTGGASWAEQSWGECW